MKGTDITDEQLRHAEDFVMKSATRGYDGEIVHIRKSDLFRLIAWYGAVRADSGNAPADLGPISRRDEDHPDQPLTASATETERTADEAFHMDSRKGDS